MPWRDIRLRFLPREVRAWVTGAGGWWGRHDNALPTAALFRRDSLFRERRRETRDLVRIATWLTLWQPPPGRQLPDYNVKVLKVVKRWQGHKALIAGSPLSRQAPLTSCEVWADAPVREMRRLTLYLDGIIFSLAAYPSSRRSAYNSCALTSRHSQAVWWAKKGDSRGVIYYVSFQQHAGVSAPSKNSSPRMIIVAA